MQPEQKGYLELIIFSLLAGTVGTFVKLIQSMDVYTILFFRAGIATLFIFAIVLFRKNLKELYLAYPFRTFLVGFIQGLALFFYFASILKTSVSNAIFLLYTAPIWSVIFAKLFFKEEIKKETIVGIIITLAGIIFIIDPRNFSFNSSQTLGNILGLASGLLYSGMAMTAKPILKKRSGYYVAFWQYLIIAIMFVFFLNIKSSNVIVENWWKLLVIGIICTGIAFILFMEGVRKVKAQKIFIVTSLEPLAGSIFALFVLGEIPSSFAIIGAALILYGVYVTTSKKFVPFYAR